MLPEESGTLPHRPWTTMSLVNGRTRKRSAAGGWSEAEVCAEEVAAPRKPMRGRFSAEAAPASSRSSYRQGRCKAPSGSRSKAQSTAPSGSNCRQGNRTAPSGSSFTAQSKAPSGRATCRTSSFGTRILPHGTSGSRPTAQSKAPSGRATCRTSSIATLILRTGTIGKRKFWQIMVPNGVVLRG